MNIVQSFANWMEDNSLATLGQDLFISRARTTPDALFWLVSTGGASSTRNVNLGYQVTHTIALHYRDSDPETVYETLNTVQNVVLGEDCFYLDGFDVISVNTSGPFTDQDLDNDDRAVGLLEISITTYKE
jgi:hypothetical protein